MSCLQGPGHTLPKKRQLVIPQAANIGFISFVLKISNSPPDSIISKPISKDPGAKERKIQISQIKDA